ncbi:MAG: hypothetical protein FWG67_00075 [Defluviitaleaceae bacterium]|nr:hypothetical protein [Defluviitaleaceae bacterium]
MSQTYNIEAILSAQDNGFSQVLSTVNNIIDGIMQNIGRLNVFATFLKNVTGSTEPMEEAFKKIVEPLKSLLEKFGIGKLTLGKVAVAFKKVTAAIALVALAIGGLILWWNDLGERNADLQESFLNAWEMISGFVNRAVERVSQSFGRLLESLSGLWNAIAPLVDLIITIIIFSVQTKKNLLRREFDSP